jgi:hypothetical protein
LTGKALGMLGLNKDCMKLPVPPVTMSARLEIFYLVISWKKLVAASVRASLRDFAPLIASFNP